MSSIPGFLRGASKAPIQTVSGPVRAGSLGLAMQPAPWRFGLLHERQADVLIWMTRGQARAIVNGVRHGLSAQMALYMPAGTVFSLDMPVTAQALYAESPVGLTDKMPDQVSVLRVRDSLAQAEITAEIDAMSRELTHGRPRSLEALEARMRLLAVWIFRQQQAGFEEPARKGASERLSQRYDALAARSYRSGQSIATYAEALDVTPTHLTRACKQSCGLTAVELLAQRRLHAARLALETGADPVQAISKSLGFSSAAYFSRFVQSHTGQSPSELRQKARKP